jgi:hypothetical protein
LAPSKQALPEATILESLIGAARAEIVSSELFFQHLIAVDDANASLDLRFRGESLASFAHRLEKMAVR